jgi:hypothetical protein
MSAVAAVTRRYRAFFVIALLALASFAMADEVVDNARLEKQRQAAFSAGFATIVDSLNAGSFDLLVSSIDRNAFLQRVYGLRLIDQGMKKDYNKLMQTQFANLVKSGFPDEKDGIKATLLGVESHGDRARALVRYDLPGLQFNYHEFELLLDTKNRLVVVDWVDYLKGEQFTDEVGNALVMAAPSKPAVRKLIDYPGAKDQDLFQLTELLKSIRDRDAKRYTEIFKNLQPDMQRQRIVVLGGVQLAKASRNRRMLRTALVQMAEHFPDEQLYSLLLLDYYVPSRLYDEAIGSLQRTYRHFGFEDAAMAARLSAINLAKGNATDATTLAERAIELEPGLELAWWSALRARVQAGDHAGAVLALQELEQQHGHTLGPAELQRDKSFAQLLASDEFTAWAASRK